MRHHPFLILIALLALPSFSRADEPGPWTGGRSTCEPVSRAAIDGPVPAEAVPLAKTWDYALEDIESLRALTCAPESVSAADELALELHRLAGELLPAIEDTAPSHRAATVRAMRGSESFFSGALDRSNSLLVAIGAHTPEGVPFSDCRARAQRGWVRARATLNHLSCEIATSIGRIDLAERAGPGEGAPMLMAARAPAALSASAMELVPSGSSVALRALRTPDPVAGETALPR